MSAGFSSSILEQLPELQCYERTPLMQGDTVVHAPGFEARTMAITEALSESDGAKAVLLDYVPFNKRNRLSDVRNSLLTYGVLISEDDILKYDRFDPADFEERLFARLSVHHSRRVIVDISTMSKLAIMLVLHVCRKMNLDVSVLYSEAENYGPSKEEFEEARDRE
jgi:hypothetical protein